MNIFSKLLFLLLLFFIVSCSRVVYSTDKTSVATSTVSSEDLSTMTGADSDWIETSPATTGLCTISDDFRIVTYTPNDPDFTGVDSCTYQSPGSGASFSATFNYSTRPVVISIGGGGAGGND